MSFRRRLTRVGVAALSLAALGFTSFGLAAAAPPEPFLLVPLLPDTPASQVAPHVWAIKGLPNIFFVVGDKATLAVDTGLGPRNGAVVAREARRLSTKGQKLYLTTTHFHPEHAGGDGGFPPGTTVIRPKAQQAELDAEGPRVLALFMTLYPVLKPLLEPVRITTAQVLFDRDYRLDLGGGVTARLMWRGPAHTRGDEMILVEPDRVLIAGDVVQDRIVPDSNCAECTPRKWVAVLDQLAPLKPRIVLPDHGGFGDGALIPQERAFLTDLIARTAALKAEGKAADEASTLIAAEFKTKYAEWINLDQVPAQVAKAYADPG